VVRKAPGDGILIPELVKRGDLEIGRFEVTRSQYLEFLSKRAVQIADDETPEKKNFPQSSVSLENAKAYAAWLSQETKQTWRIPYEDEVKSLYENRDSENTLDYWAGYAPNPEDTAHLRAKAKELKDNAALLKQVGSFRGQGKDDEEPIFDLGGNVAEWVLTRDGKGKVIGCSADCPADIKSNCTPAPEYVGFRVVRGAAKDEAKK
jgi:formylglycine-generating enzyme required for sulfatase activity